ncbi:MAG TPA: glycosyltransferase family 29 protein [Pyrinomonadaceae bacterium]
MRKVSASEEIYPSLEDLRREFAHFDADADYAQLLEGKNVVIVGPAETLLGSEQGGFIDSHDLVVRINTALEHMPFAARLAADIGTRSDILYCNNEVLTENILRRKHISHRRFMRLCDEINLKYLVATNNNFTCTDIANPHHPCFLEHRAFQEFLNKHPTKTKLRMLYWTSNVLRRWLHGYVGRTGTIAIVDLLSYNIKRLYVTGMTFYHRGGHLFYRHCVPELHPLKDHLGRDTNLSDKGHNSYVELELMTKLASLFEERLKLDENLHQLVVNGAREVVD